MSFGVVVNGISIPDEKVIAVHGLSEETNAAYVGSQVGLLKSQVLEVRKWLRDGLADEIDHSRKKKKPKPAPPPPPQARKVFDKKPVGKPNSVAKKPSLRKPSALEVLAVIAQSSARIYQKDIMQITNFYDRRTVQDILKGLRSKNLVDYKNPGTYSPTLEGISYLRLRDPDCKPHEKALARAQNSASGVVVKSKPEKPKQESDLREVKELNPSNVLYCEGCAGAKGMCSNDCPRVKKADKNLTESLEKQSASIDSHLADIDNIFEKQAIQKLETQVELLNKIHELTGKLAEEMQQSLAEVKTFLGSN